jgi:hypothetical protein
MTKKEITVVFYRRRLVRQDPILEIDPAAQETFFSAMEKEFAPFGIAVRPLEETDLSMDVKGYGDLLNSIRLRSPRDGIGNLCLGHIIEPEGSDKIVCHNCGCGC